MQWFNNKIQKDDVGIQIQKKNRSRLLHGHTSKGNRMGLKSSKLWWFAYMLGVGIMVFSKLRDLVNTWQALAKWKHVHDPKAWCIDSLTCRWLSVKPCDEKYVLSKLCQSLFDVRCSCGEFHSLVVVQEDDCRRRENHVSCGGVKFISDAEYHLYEASAGWVQIGKILY